MKLEPEIKNLVDILNKVTYIPVQAVKAILREIPLKMPMPDLMFGLEEIN